MDGGIRSCWAKWRHSHFIVYVGVLGGIRMIKTIESVREHIEMDEPAGLQKYLGIHHAKDMVEIGGHMQTT